MKRLAGIAALLLAAQAAATERLTLATWNLEWMMTPATFDRLAPTCFRPGRRVGGSDRAIPCDIVLAGRWSAEDVARLRAFAAKVPLDVVALQETDGVDAAAQIFPDHAFCFTERKHVQNVGFAIRRGIPHRCNRDYRALGLAGNDVRWGADVTLYPGTAREIRLLSVHLKSSCQSELLTSYRPGCSTLQQQVPVLEAWIDARSRNDSVFAVLGDFNRRFDRERDEARDAHGRIVALWPEIDDGEPAGSDLHDAGEQRRIIGCNNGETPRAPIDHLVLGRRMTRRLVPDSFHVWRYRGRGRWPDHCVLSIEIELEARDGV
ncbi:MAG: endonuclease/exonuclease/phosphatase family protein [Gammaproteobacteria bacterium]